MNAALIRLHQNLLLHQLISLYQHILLHKTILFHHLFYSINKSTIPDMIHTHTLYSTAEWTNWYRHRMAARHMLRLHSNPNTDKLVF